MPLREEYLSAARDSWETVGSSVRNRRDDDDADDMFSWIRVLEDNCGVLGLSGSDFRFRSLRWELVQPSSMPYLTHLEQGR